jgi:hypothetical protein
MAREPKEARKLTIASGNQTKKPETQNEAQSESARREQARQVAADDSTARAARADQTDRGSLSDRAAKAGLDPETGLPPADSSPVPAPYSQRPPRLHERDVRPREAGSLDPKGDTLASVEKEISRIEALSRIDPKDFWDNERMHARSLIDQLQALVARLQKLNLS